MIFNGGLTSGNRHLNTYPFQSGGIILLIGILAFLSTVAFARYIERGAVFKMKAIVILTFQRITAAGNSVCVHHSPS
ncbi:monovalent cation/H+ antiporter complex subunit F [Paenibacillus cisolokensis]|uniref:monovalent cation/H+ antiporter complex subunit F n=1 Tax=Paenibacillus cisolokensis TaxID=1658519 RepID=UPI003D292E29